MPYTLQQIREITGARTLQLLHPEATIDHLLLDTRHLDAPEQGLFFAIQGERHDAHQFLSEAYESGVRHFVVSRHIDTQPFPEADLLLVDNSLYALQALAAHHRAQMPYPVLGITGSNGKTIVKEWIYQLLQDTFDIVRSPKSYNSQVGVPLSVWQMQTHHELAIIEAGISKPGEMERLYQIIRPDVGIFTNLGPAHSEGFGSNAQKAAEKMLLFQSAHTLIYCADNPLIRPLAETWESAEEGRQCLSWSCHNANAQIQYELEPSDAGGFIVTVVHQQSPLAGMMPMGDLRVSYSQFELPYADDASVENALHCYTFLYWAGISPEVAAEGMSRLEPVEMRLEIKAGINRCTLLNDAYSNDLASLRIALQVAAQQARLRPVVLILSDILQSGESDQSLYQKVAELLDAQGVERLIGIGSKIPMIEQFLPEYIHFSSFPSTDDFVAQIKQTDFSDALVVIKGARVFEFEKIATRLEQKAHKTVLEINLSAVVHNLQVYHRMLQPGVKMMVMVKAAGYGAGPAELARLLEYHKVDYLGVAYADEGIELRQAGVQTPILVLNPEPTGFDAMYRFKLEPEIYNYNILQALLDYTGPDKHFPVHIKLDTGMHRLGFEPDDLPALLDTLAAYPNLEVKSVFSHLSGSDAENLDYFTHRQAAQFKQMYAQIAERIGYSPLRHIVNSSGIARFPEYHFDMVRLGIGLYGVDAGAVQDQLKVVNTLKATISQIREVRSGETVGYNRNGPINHTSRIATISIGYADGLLRLAGNGRYSVAVHGKTAPTVGNICMDMCMIDVSSIPEAEEGDEVVVFGAYPTVQSLAQCLQTIPYEVFTNVSERVKRVYYQE